MALCDGGPPIMERLGVSDRGADPRAQLGQLVEINLTSATKLCLQEPIGNCNVAMCAFDFVFSSKMGVADTMWIAASEALTLTEVRASLWICNGHASFFFK